MIKKFKLNTGLNVDDKFVIDTDLDTIDISIPVTFTQDVTFEGTTTQIDTTILTVEDKNIEIGVTETTPTDTSANAGGITLKGTTDKTIYWLDGNDSWNFNQHINLDSDVLEYKIDDTTVLTKDTLGPTVTQSSLTSLGILTELYVDGPFGFNENWSVENIDFISIVNNKYFVDTSSNTITVTIPTTDLSIGQVLEFQDLNETFHINNVTLQGDTGLGFTFEGNTDTVLVLDVQNANVKLVYTGDPAFGWKRVR